MKLGDTMLQSNQPYQKSDSGFSFSGMGYGMGMAAFQMGIVDLPHELMLRKDISQMKEGRMKNFFEAAQISHKSMMNPNQTGMMPSMYRAMKGSTKNKLITYGATMAAGGLLGGLFKND